MAEKTIHMIDDITQEDGVGQAAVKAIPGDTVEEGRDAKAPFYLLFGIAGLIAVIVAVVLTLALVIPYLITGHWPL
jgi:hypothetical protein